MTRDQILNGSLESDIRRAFDRVRPYLPPGTHCQAALHIKDGQPHGFFFLSIITNATGGDLVTTHGTWEQAASAAIQRLQDPAIIAAQRRAVLEQMSTLQQTLSALPTDHQPHQP